MQIGTHRLTLRTEGGCALEDARVVFARWGALSSVGDNVVLLPSYYTGTHESYAPLIGAGRALDPARYCIIAANLFGNGISTSPSHGDRPDVFPRVSIADNVRAQHDLLRTLGVTRIALVAGWSLGAMQALHWAMLFPEYVRGAVAICGTAFCWPINVVFLGGLAPILESACSSRPRLAERDALDMFGRAYAGWAYSAAFFRDGLYRDLGFANIGALLDDWARDHQRHRAADLLAVLRTWGSTVMTQQAASAALARITACCTIVPCDTDSYFTVEDAGVEARAVPHARLIPLQSPYGHCAGAPGRFPDETTRIEQILRDALSP